MPTDRSSRYALKNLISEVDLILETAPDLPQNRTARSRELLSVAIALADDLISQAQMPAATAMGHKGGTETARKYGSDHFRQLAAKRKTNAGGRPRSEPNKPSRSQLGRMGVLKRKARHGGRGFSVRPRHPHRKLFIWPDARGAMAEVPNLPLETLAVIEHEKEAALKLLLSLSTFLFRQETVIPISQIHRAVRKPATLKLELRKFTSSLFDVEAKHYSKHAKTAAELKKWLASLALRIGAEVSMELKSFNRSTTSGLKVISPRRLQTSAGTWSTKIRRSFIDKL
jgi:hypothetical protein